MRYSAKLLFIWDPDPVTGSRHRRLCEERIVVFQARSAHDAVRKAKSIGRQGQLRYDSGHQLQFVGILQCMDLDLQDPDEVWWEYQRRLNPAKWAKKTIPPESELYVFTDYRPKTNTLANKALQPTSRAKRSAKSIGRTRADRG